MKKERSSNRTSAPELPRADISSLSRCVRLGLSTALGASLVLGGHEGHWAQHRRKEKDVTVTGIAASGGTVSISADGSLNRAQTWQDAEGFHVVLPGGQTALGGSPRGVKVRRVGDSLELVVPVRAGASVTVQPRGERLDLVVNSAGGFAPEAAAEEPARPAARRRVREAAETGENREASSRRQSAASVTSEAPAPQRRERAPQNEQAPTELNASAGGAPKAAAPSAEQPVAAGAGGDVPPPAGANLPDAAATSKGDEAPAKNTQAPSAPASLKTGGASLGSLIFSLPSLLVLVFAALGGALFFLRKRREGDAGEGDAPPSGRRSENEEVVEGSGAAASTPFEQLKGDRRKERVSVPFERRREGRGAEDVATRDQRTLEGSPKAGEAANPALPSVVYGAYRIDQEVGLLIAGRPHSVEVISSRAADDRRAVSTSLQKILSTPGTHEDERRRARMALEDYGFVARECASLLLGAESFERASAARSLGEMRSSQALPFLTEALYDHDTVVRVEAVQSLGALGLPSAIGALLHTASSHPDIPSSVIGPALTACSVESLELAWDAPGDSRTFAESEDELAGEVRVIAPVCGVEELPEWLEDEALTAALESLNGGDVGARLHAAQQLAQFQVRRAVEALASLAVGDEEAAVRAAATTSLGLINHESVFVPVVMALNDEAREVRAAAARATSRLSFDRTDAYVRVLETADEGTLRAVACACVGAGLAGQALSRLACEDRRQAYEAFTLLSLVVKGGEAGPVLEAIESHSDVNVRLACVGLLGMTLAPEPAERLRRISDDARVPERVRHAIRETLQHTERHQPA